MTHDAKVRPLSNAIIPELFALLADELRALSVAKAAPQLDRSDQKALAAFSDRRCATWAILEAQWVDPAVKALEADASRTIDPVTIVDALQAGQSRCAGEIWLFTEQVNRVFSAALNGSDLSGDQRIALARAWDGYCEDSAHLTRLISSNSTGLQNAGLGKPDNIFTSLSNAVAQIGRAA